VTEANQVDAAVRRHLGPLGRFKRVTHATEPGWPDWHYVCRGQQGWLEDKLIPPSCRCPGTFTLDQLIWGEAEAAAGGRWHLLGLEPRSRTWLLFNAHQARRWYDGLDHDLTVEATGLFPTKELVLALAPRRYNACP
jgi:hypothetical protein